MKKRENAQSGIISVVLIILLVLAAIIILWVVVSSILKNSSENIDEDIFLTTLGIEKAKFFVTYGSEIEVHRNSGNAEISELKFVFENKKGENRIVIKNETMPKVLETGVFHFSSQEIKFNNSEIKKISVYPVFNKNIGIESWKLADKRLAPAPGLTNWWTFDSESILENINFISSGVSFADNPNGGKIAVFDGNTGFINASKTSTTKSLPFSISSWIFFNSIGDEKGIITKYKDGSSNGFKIFTMGASDSGSICASYYRDSSNYAAIAREGGGGIGAECISIEKNKWYFLVISVNSTGIYMYIDGLLAQYSEWNGTPGDSTENTDFIIGNYPPSNFFNGSLKNIIIFNRSISDSEITGIYNNQK